ncbi:Uncharacterised protein [Candidatus Ornithobacterium hominis]|uniref:hypothetical protein n=1 Tax=Candidatus Ornithobacterium hominis TaxID=2497989 RepID=UPI000E5A66BA|nr:hypothetical protein [Candidatus Ornithobacterium hominis]SZD72749.1 Uncharacterised protein [Candidatus Ornithobacterium hominis]
MKNIVQKLTQNGDEIYAKICEVTAVDSAEQTADLQPIDGSSPILEALIQVAENGIYTEPKIGSLVACVFISKEKAVIVNYSEVKQIQTKIESVEFRINADGFLLKKENETLAKLMTDLLQEIQRMKFTTSNGPTIQLINQPQFLAIENRFKQLLKQD